MRLNKTDKERVPNAVLEPWYAPIKRAVQSRSTSIRSASKGI